MIVVGLFNSKARVAKIIAAALFSSLGIDSPLNDVEQEIVDRYHVNEANYRSEKRILMAFAMSHALHHLENSDKREIAKLANTEFAQLMAGLIERKSKEAGKGLILRIDAYDKALRHDGGGLMVSLPSAFADWVDRTNEAARLQLIAVGLVTFVTTVNGSIELFQDCIAKF